MRLSRLNLIIADTDTAYMESMANYIISNYSKRFQVSSFTKEDYLNQFLEGSNIRVDILLISPELYSRYIQKIEISTVILLTDGRFSEEVEGCHAVNKYQNADKLVTNIIKFYAEDNRDIVFIPEGENNTKVVAFFSPAGGTGKTTVAINFTKQLAEQDIPVFYLNLENIPSTSGYFNVSDENSLSNMLFYIKEKNKNLGLRIEAQRSIDESQVHFFPPQESLLEMDEMLPEELALLLNQLKLLNQYEYVAVDMSSCLNKQTAALLKECDSIVLVLNQDKANYIKMKIFEKELQRLSERNNINLVDKVELVLNKYFQNSINEFENYSIGEKQISVYLPFEEEIPVCNDAVGGIFSDGIGQLINGLICVGG